MMASLFWTIATSETALWIDGAILLVAGVIGWFPLLRWFPILGTYVPLARAVFVAVLFVFGVCIGHRLADESAEADSLRAQLAAKTTDLNAAKDAAKQADEARADLVAQAAQDEQRINDYAEALKKRPDAGCVLTPDDFTSGVRH